MAGNRSIRILLVDGYEMVRKGLRLILESKPGFSVVGDTGVGKDAVEIASREQPDIILLDPIMVCDERHGLLSDLLKAAGGARVIMLMTARTSPFYQQVVGLGAMGLVSKQETSETLVNAIDSVNAGGIWLEGAAAVVELPPDLRGNSVDSGHAGIAMLTRREREVAALVARGLKNKQIAQSLFISGATVSHHLTSIFNKLGVSDRSQLIIYALRHGLNKN